MRANLIRASAARQTAKGINPAIFQDSLVPALSDLYRNDQRRFRTALLRIESLSLKYPHTSYLLCRSASDLARILENKPATFLHLLKMSGEVKYKPAFFIKHCALPLFSRFADSPEKVYHFLRDLNFTLDRLRIKWNDFADLDLPQLLKDPQLTLDKLNDLLSYYRYPEMQGNFGYHTIEFRDGGNCPNLVYLPAKFTLAETPTPRRGPLPQPVRRPKFLHPRLHREQA